MPSSNPLLADPSPHTQADPQPIGLPRRTPRQVLLSYFYWTYSRGSFHYDVMVTLILAFIFVTPHIHGFSYGDKPTTAAALIHPIQVVSDGGHGVILTVRASDANVPPGASNAVVKKALRKAIEPVTGDAEYVEKWQTFTDADGNLFWKVWAHR